MTRIGTYLQEGVVFSRFEFDLWPTHMYSHCDIVMLWYSRVFFFFSGVALPWALILLRSVLGWCGCVVVICGCDAVML